MSLNIREATENPKRKRHKRWRKLRAGCRHCLTFAREFFRGNYTGQTIDLEWHGKPLRTDFINQLIRLNDYKKYLEIGCHNNKCFTAVLVESKIGVDPNKGGTLRMTSDAFFAQNRDTFDLIFIDGLHTYEQVKIDISNAVRVLNPAGTIVLHDCLPASCLAQYDSPVIKVWNGDVWKALVEARTDPGLDAATCLIDHGVGVIKKRKNAHPLHVGVDDFKRLRFSFLAKDYARLLNTLEFPQALAFAAEKQPLH